MVFAPPHIAMVERGRGGGGRGDGLNMKILQNLGVIFITIFLHFHYFISLEIANTQESEVFLFRICLENVNASVVTC